MDDEVRREIAKLAAESLALQTILNCLLYRLKRVDPSYAEVFDDAAHIIENLALGRAKGVGHLPETLRIIEELRAGVASKSEPKHRV
jgi:hypothetical protein